MIHALSGMGADQRMYPPPWSSLPGFIAHDWMRYSSEQSLAAVAQSMCVACRIQDGDTLVGASLGGMVACEITKLRKIPALFLIGSTTEKEGVSRILTALHPMAQVTPFGWFQAVASKLPVEVAQMFAGMDPSFVRAMCAAIFEWKGLGVSPTKVYRIHGRFDLVIPPPPRVDLLLNGGHLISRSHAKECTTFIQKTLNNPANHDTGLQQP